MSDTPRTDALVIRMEDRYATGTWQEVVPSHRELERELFVTRAECDALRAENEHLRKTAHEHVSRALYDAHTAELRAEADALRAELREVTEAMNDPAVNNIRTLAESIRILQAERGALLEACVAYSAWADAAVCSDPELRAIRQQMRAAIDAAREAGE